jgi:hypothetical protein
LPAVRPRDRSNRASDALLLTSSAYASWRLFGVARERRDSSSRFSRHPRAADDRGRHTEPRWYSTYPDRCKNLLASASSTEAAVLPRRRGHEFQRVWPAA